MVFWRPVSFARFLRRYFPTLPTRPRPDRPRRRPVRRRAAIGAALACGLAAEPAAAADQAEIALATVVYDTLLVRGRGLADQVFPLAPSVVTVVDLEGERGGGDLAELLARVAGLQVRRYGGLGAQAVPSVRGSTGAQVQVLIDGLPLVDAQAGAVDLSLLPLERFDRAEIHRGLVPVGFGGIGAAGAVNLRTRAEPRDREVRVFAGSFGDVGGRASQSLSGGGGARRAWLLVHGRRLDNRYTFTPWIPVWTVDPLDLPDQERRNADLAEWGLFGQGELNGQTGSAQLAAGWFRRDGGRPGPQNAPSLHARVRHDRIDGRLGAATRSRTVTCDLAASRRRDRLDDPRREVGHDPYDRVDAVSEDLFGRVVWAPELAIGAVGLGPTAGGDWRGEWFRETNDGAAAPLRNRRTVSLFAGLSVDLSPARLVLTPAWRWQRIRDNLPPVPALPWLPEEAGVEHVQDAVSPAVGASWQAVPGRVVVEAHWHRTVRQPTWIELFGQPGGLLGNRELAPERIAGGDLGVRWHWPRPGLAVRATAFAQGTDRTIIYYLAGPGMSRPVNIGRSRTRGIELEAAWRRGRLDLAANATWQRARDRGEEDPTYFDKALPYLSDRELHADLRCRVGGWRPGLTVIHQSANFRDRYNLASNRAPARTLWNLALERALRGGPGGRGRTATFTAELMNVTGNQVHDVEGYPLPGRSVRLSCRWF